MLYVKDVWQDFTKKQAYMMIGMVFYIVQIANIRQHDGLERFQPFQTDKYIYMGV